MVITHDVVVRTGARLDPAVAGVVVWAAAIALSVGGSLHLTTFQGFLLLGPLVVVPLGRPLIADDRTSTRWLLALAAAAIVPALAVPPGAASAALALPWLAATLLMAAADTGSWRRARSAAGRWSGDVSLALLGAMASGWLIVGAVSLVASRSAVFPFGLTPALTELGAVHFSYAGFAATVIARCVLARSPHAVGAAAAAAATVGGAGLVLVGHLTVRPLELAGAISMTAGVVTIGVLSWSLGPPRTAARVLLRIAALGVIVPMALALHYAWSLTVGTPHLPYETIARIHGSLNAVAFSLGGLLAWRLLRPQTDHEGSTI